MARKQVPKTVAPPDLAQVRARIDAVDAGIHALISERAGLAQLVGISKGKNGRTVDFYRPEREAAGVAPGEGAQ